VIVVRAGRLGKRSAASIQRQIIERMHAYHRYPFTGFTGPIAFDLYAVAARRCAHTIFRRDTE
jgi:hypothetical protein